MRRKSQREIEGRDTERPNSCTWRNTGERRRKEQKQTPQVGQHERIWHTRAQRHARERGGEGETKEQSHAARENLAPRANKRRKQQIHKKQNMDSLSAPAPTANCSAPTTFAGAGNNWAKGHFQGRWHARKKNCHGRELETNIKQASVEKRR